jgi:hypothetical protein
MFTIIGYCRKSRSVAASAMGCFQCFCLGTFLLQSVSAHAGLFSSSKKPAQLVIQPPAIELHGAKDIQGLLVTAVMPDGSQIDVTDSARFSSKQPKIVSISTNGLCRPVSDGTAQIVVEYAGRTERVAVTAQESQTISKPSFRQDVLPVLTKTGCNAGACHGKLAGQNGFKLSLRAFAPDWDYGWLTTEVHSRRIDYAFPNESLMILKATGQVPHEGGQRFAAASRYQQTLTDWITARTPGPVTNELDAAKIEVLPGNRMLKPGATQRLLVRAHYPDGHVRDVTWLTQFFSNDDAVLEVTPEGRVRAKRSGETAIRAHFQGQVEVVTFTIPYENKVPGSEFAQRNDLLDEPVFKKLESLRIPPSALCDDSTFLRRVSLDLTGTLPSAEEVQTFVADQAAEKRERLVDDLLKRPEFVDYWTLQLSDLLQNRKERDHDVRGTKGVRSFHSWLRAQVAANRPWDKLARDVIAASGDVVSSPQIGYYITLVGEKQHAEESEIGDSIAQSFLGSRIGCAKCHNHPLEKYTQDDYYHFSAFFSKVSLKRENPDAGRTMLSTRSHEELEQEKQISQIEKALADAEAALNDKTGDELDKSKKKVTEQEKKLAEAHKQLEKLQAKMPVITQPRTKKPMAPQPLDRSGFDFHPGEDLRARLAEWITSPANENFSGAMVNRLWKHFLGVGLVEQVDDLRASNPPSNAELWKILNREFVSSKFDLKHLMRLIANSRTYQLSSTTLPGNEKDRRFYSHYYAHRLPAEVLMDALSLATDVPDSFSGYPTGIRAIQLPEPGVGSYFLSLFGRSDRVTACACERSGDVTLPQLLHLNNGEEIGKKLRDNDGRLARLLKDSKNDSQLTEAVFLSTLSRRPNEKETAAIQKSLSVGEKREEVYRDLFWAVLNSKEFAFNH